LISLRYKEEALAHSARAFLLMDRQKLAFERDSKKKARSSRPGGSKAFSLLSTPKRIMK